MLVIGVPGGDRGLTPRVSWVVPSIDVQLFVSRRRAISSCRDSARCTNELRG